MKQISVHHLCDDGGNNKINGNSNTETGTRTIDANIIFIMSIKHLPSTQNHTIHSNYTPRKCEGDEVRVSDATKYSTLVAEQRETEKDSPEVECTMYMCIVCACVSFYTRVCSCLQIQIAIKFQCTTRWFVCIALVLVCSWCTITVSIYGLHSSIILNAYHRMKLSGNAL